MEARLSSEENSVESPWQHPTRTVILWKILRDTAEEELPYLISSMLETAYNDNSGFDYFTLKRFGKLPPILQHWTVLKQLVQVHKIVPKELKSKDEELRFERTPTSLDFPHRIMKSKYDPLVHKEGIGDDYQQAHVEFFDGNTWYSFALVENCYFYLDWPLEKDLFHSPATIAREYGRFCNVPNSPTEIIVAPDCKVNFKSLTMYQVSNPKNRTKVRIYH
jgi:hypothetical protein